MLVVPSASPFEVTTLTMMVFFVELVLERRANKHTEGGGLIKVQWQSPQLYRQSCIRCSISAPIQCSSLHLAVIFYSIFNLCTQGNFIAVVALVHAQIKNTNI